MISKDLITIAIKASIEAGKEIMQIYDGDMAIETKDDDSPLTIADRNANDVINSYLIDTPYPIISEENKNAGYEERKNWETCWIVDPLDGTKEFIKKNGEFTVNIALVSSGKPVLGVIYVPATNLLYFTDESMSKAFKIEINGAVNIEYPELQNTASQIFPTKEDGQILNIVGSRSHLNEDTQHYVDSLKKDYQVEIVSKGSSLKFCLVAEGLAHRYPRFAPTMEWDTAAGQAICEAVGVEVIDNGTQQPLLYNKESLLNPYFLVKSY